MVKEAKDRKGHAQVANHARLNDRQQNHLHVCAKAKWQEGRAAIKVSTKEETRTTRTKKNRMNDANGSSSIARATLFCNALCQAKQKELRYQPICHCAKILCFKSMRPKARSHWSEQEDKPDHDFIFTRATGKCDSVLTNIFKNIYKNKMNPSLRIHGLNKKTILRSRSATQYLCCVRQTFVANFG